MATISVEDEEETIEEEEANEGLVDHQTELSNLAKEGRPEHLAASLNTQRVQKMRPKIRGRWEPTQHPVCGAVGLAPQHKGRWVPVPA